MPTSFARQFWFRLALGQALAYLALSAFVFAALYFGLTRTLEGQLRREITRDTEALLAAPKTASAAALEDAIRARSASRGEPSWYGLRDASGAALVGSEGLPRAAGWTLEPAPQERQFREPVEHPFLVLTTKLPDGGLVVIGRDMHAEWELGEFSRRAAGWLLLLNLLLALGMGLLASRSLRARFRPIRTTTEAVAAGQLGNRVELSARGDEFDEHAAQINTMLDRIEGLMRRLRQVSLDVAHELRTPLTRLRQRLDPDSPAPEDWPRVIASARADLDGLLSTFDALLRVARIEDGSAREHFKVVDIAQVVGEVVEIYRPVADDSAHVLEATIAGPVNVVGDRALLVQLASNLIENWLRHTPAGCRQRVRVERSGEQAVLVFEDDGPGIGAETLAFLREPLGLRGRSNIGNGIGLSLVRAIVQAHDGTVEFESQLPHGARIVARFTAV